MHQTLCSTAEPVQFPWFITSQRQFVPGQELHADRHFQYTARAMLWRDLTLIIRNVPYVDFMCQAFKVVKETRPIKYLRPINY